MVRKINENRLQGYTSQELDVAIKDIIKNNGFKPKDVLQFQDFCFAILDQQAELVTIVSNTTSETYRLLYRVNGTFAFSLRDVSVMDYDKSVKFRQDVHGLSKILEQLQDLG